MNRRLVVAIRIHALRSTTAMHFSSPGMETLYERGETFLNDCFCLGIVTIKEHCIALFEPSDDDGVCQCAVMVLKLVCRKAWNDTPICLRGSSGNTSKDPAHGFTAIDLTGLPHLSSELVANRYSAASPCSPHARNACMSHKAAARHNTPLPHPPFLPPQTHQTISQHQPIHPSLPITRMPLPPSTPTLRPPNPLLRISRNILPTRRHHQLLQKSRIPPIPHTPLHNRLPYPSDPLEKSQIREIAAPVHGLKDFDFEAFDSCE